MGELSAAMRMLSMPMSTAILRVNHPIHKGAPNPAHGKYFFVGRVPASCCDANGSSFKYDTEDAAILAARAAGATRIQRTDCTFA